ncbi:MAG: penicillin-binding transpeptidase domain-containing protein [Eubacteriales bacterium]|nr:penicillin-binding transpeptidase domain-containing protein [Eubacteriales bacterium]
MRPTKYRYFVFIVLLFLVFTMMFGQLVNLQLIDSNDYVAQADSKSTRTVNVFGKRGTIYDRNMTVLAYDRESYNVQFYRDPDRNTQADREAYTQVIYELIRLIESNGNTTVNDFWLSRDENGQWQFDTGGTTEYVRSERERQWRENFYLTSKSDTVDTLFDTLCENYGVPEELDEEMKIKILAIWQESRMSAYLSTPVTIAYDVSQETVSEIEVRSMELDGVSISESYERVYPQGEAACHIIGYISRISGSDSLEDYLEKGYSRDSLVGMSGIEASMEDQLTASISYRQGEQVFEVNNRGKAVRELSYTEPIDGNDVILTIDLDLQRVMDDALEKQIKALHEEEIEVMSDRWQRKNAETLAEYAESGREVQLAETGAMVALDPNNGEVLAMSSYPTFDLSLFSGVISPGDWNDIVTADNNPLYNRAVSARDTPGSIFKMVTALGSLMEGNLTLDRTITDAGEFLGTTTVNHPKCWISEQSRHKHANQTVVEGIKNSCNYFFYTIGAELGISGINKWVAQLGLTTRTGIELNSETTSFVGNQDKLYDLDRSIENQYTSKPTFAYYTIIRKLREIGSDRGIEYDEERLAKAAKSIMDIAGDLSIPKSDWPKHIRNVLMDQMGLPSEYISHNFLANEFYYYIQDLRWTENETIMAAIGQSITQVTPVAVARYVAAIANGGTVYDVQLVDKIVSSTGSIVLDKEPVVANQITGADDYLEAIRQGMEEVADENEDGTASLQFAGFEYSVGAKTGTAERTELDVENNAWLVTYAPADDPQIVVITYIQNGYSGSHAADAPKAVIKYYLDSLRQKEDLTFCDENTLAD